MVLPVSMVQHLEDTQLAKASVAWKNLERLTATMMRGERQHRGADFSESGVDVVVPDFSYLKVDAKCYARHAHHSLVREIAHKYCEKPNDVPVLVTRENRKRPVNVTVSLIYFAWLHDEMRRLRRALVEAKYPRAAKNTVEELLANNPVIYNPEGLQIKADAVEYNDAPGIEGEAIHE